MADAPRLTEIFAPKLITTTLRAALLTTGAQGGYYAITTWLPTFLKTERHLTVMGTGGYLAMIIFGSWVGYLTSAYLTDRLGRKPNFILFAVGSMVIAFAYVAEPDQRVDAVARLSARLLRIGHLLGDGRVPHRTVPDPRARFRGLLLQRGPRDRCAVPVLIGALSKQYGTSIGIFAVAAYGVVIVAALTLPETRGRELDAA